MGEILHAEPGAPDPPAHHQIEDVGFDAKEEEDYHPEIQVCQKGILYFLAHLVLKYVANCYQKSQD